MPSSFSQTHVHIVFSTKFRIPYIDKSIESELFGYIGQTCNNLKCSTIIVGGYRNHIHVYCYLHRAISQSDLVKEIKMSSSKWIKTKGKKYTSFRWQRGYSIFSVNPRNADRLIRYIKNQELHHKTKKFKQEYRQLLASYQIPYDEKYIWD